VRRSPLAAVVGALCCAVVFVAPSGAQAATTSYTALVGTRAAFSGSLHEVRPAASFATVTAAPTFTPTAPTAHTSPLAFRSPRGPVSRGPRTHAPVVAGETLTTTAEAVTARGGSGTPGVTTPGFVGLNQRTSAGLNGGFGVAPPDPALCVGTNPSSRTTSVVVFSAVNLAIEETTTAGKLIRRESLASWFQDPDAYGEVRCVYDAATKAFYFTEVKTPGGYADPTLDDTWLDVAVLNAKGFAVYSFPTSETGSCFGDQPETGFDANALLVSTDEYCGPGLTTYGGALLDVVSLADMDSHAAAYMETFRVPNMAGLTVVGLDPAVGSPGTTGYLLNTFPYATRTFTVENTTINLLGLWSLSDTGSITHGLDDALLTGLVVGSESYAAPVPAKSATGTSLDPDDSRISGPVVSQQVPGVGPELWATATTAVLRPGGTPFDPTTLTDGVAWFELNPVKADVIAEGYVAGPRTVNLIDPAIALTPHAVPGVAMAFTATGPSLYPSAAYSAITTKKIQIVATGHGPQITLANRWGDYSSAQGFGKALWMVTEYIPPTTDWLPTSNWGTYVFRA
jgi:hypothetical protein